MLTLPMRASAERRNAGSMNLPRAFVIALVLEAAGITLLMNMPAPKHAPAPPEPIVMQAIAPEPVKPIEPPPPPPKPEIKQVIKTPPKIVREAAPVKLDAPKPAAVAAPDSQAVSVPKDVGTPRQSEGPPDAPPSPPKLAVRSGVQRIAGEYPSYPAQAMRRKIEGKVLVHLTVKPDGSVAEIRIVRAQPPGVFDAEVQRALRGWKFAADPVGFIGEVEIKFAMPSDDE